MFSIDSPGPSEARIRANRENAQKSTGPRTAEGKTASSRNGLKHGLCAETHFIADEDPAEFQALLDDLYTRFRPLGEGEEALVRRIAMNQWRLARVPAFEAGIYRGLFNEATRKEERRRQDYEFASRWAKKEEKPEPAPPEPFLEADRPAKAFCRDAETDNALTKLSRYEAGLERCTDRCLRQLKAFQAVRQAAAPTPAPEPPPQPIKTNKTNPTQTYQANPISELPSPEPTLCAVPIPLSPPKKL